MEDDKMEEQLKELKCIISAFLVTEKGGMTIPQLEKEYRSNEGQPVPYAKFGCSNIREFLHKISDAVRIAYVNGEERVQAKGNADLEYIQCMVKQQKPSTTKGKVRHSMVHSRAQRGRPASNFGQRNRFHYQSSRQQLPTQMAPSRPTMPRPRPAGPPLRSTVPPPRSTVPSPHSAMAAPRSTMGTRRSTMGIPRSTMAAPHSAMAAPHSAMAAPHSAMATPHSAMATPHSAMATQHSTMAAPHSTMATQWSAMPPPSGEPETSSSMPENRGTSSQPNLTSSTSNGEAAPEKLSKLHNLLFNRAFTGGAQKSCGASETVPVETDASGQAEVQIPDSSGQGGLAFSVEQLLEAAASAPHAQVGPQRVPYVSQYGQSAQNPALQPVASYADPWTGENYFKNVLPQYPQPRALAPGAAGIPVYRPWGPPASPYPPPIPEFASPASFPAVQQPQSALNPGAAEYKPGHLVTEGVAPQVAQASATTSKEFADKQMQAADSVETKDKQTSTIDLAIDIPLDFSACVRSLLEGNVGGLGVEALLEMCRHKLGNNAYFTQNKNSLEMVRDVLFAVPSICVVSDSARKFTVRLCSDSKAERPGLVLPDDLSHSLMSVLFDYPEGLEASDLFHMHNRRFGEHEYIRNHCKSTFDFVRNILVALPCTTLVSHGGGRYTVNVHREQLQDECQAPLTNCRAEPLSRAADESDSLVEASSYSFQTVPGEQPFPVIIGEVFSPTMFYMLIAAGDMFTKFDTMMAELDKFYSSTAADFYVVRSNDLKPGLVCAALYADGRKAVWHRAVVKSVRVHSAYVAYVDYGTFMSVKIEDIRRLRGDFLELPAQAIKAALAGVKPKEGGEWSSEANNRFLELVRRGHYEQCSCSVWGKENDALTVELVQKFEDTEYSVGDVLVNDGLAESTVGSGAGAADSSVETWTLPGGLKVRVVTWNAERYVSGAELSRLCGWQGDRVTETLVERKISFSGTLVERRLNPELHYQICRSEEDLRPGGIRLYHLQGVPDILRVLQHPSKSLVDELEGRLGKKLASQQTLLSVCSLPERNKGACQKNAAEECNDCQKNAAFRQKLCSKLEAWKKRRGTLRMALYENSDPSVLADLKYAEQKVESIAKVLNQLDTNSGTLNVAEELCASLSSIDLTDTKSESSGTDNMSENVVYKFQSKLLEVLKASKSK